MELINLHATHISNEQALYNIAQKENNLSAYCIFLKWTWNTMSYCFNLYQNLTPSNTSPYKVLLIQEWNFSTCVMKHINIVYTKPEKIKKSMAFWGKEIIHVQHVLNM